MTTAAHERDGIPELRAGDRLTRDEFERRYNAMPHLKKAELIEGVVYMPSPVSDSRHGRPHAQIVGWLLRYEAFTPSVACSNDATVRLDLDNEPQPDAHLRILDEQLGTARTVDGYVEGPPELACEVTASRVSYDLHDKLHAYRRNGVQEYVVWRVDDAAIDWFALHGSEYERLAPAADGTFHSEVFPGLWLDARALLARDLRAVLEVLDQGLATREHAAFVERLAGRPPIS